MTVAFVAPLGRPLSSTTSTRSSFLPSNAPHQRCTRPHPSRIHLPARPHLTPRMDASGSGIYHPSTAPSSVRVVVFGPTGYIGRFVANEFIARGYAVTAFARSRSGVDSKSTEDDVRRDFPGARRVVFGDVTDLDSTRRAFREDAEGEGEAQREWAATVVVSCLASRSGGIEDSNKIDYEATRNALVAGREAGAGHFVLLSAICVQKPLLEFQRAKLKFEAALREEAERDADFSYSIVRPTAFFKSLAAQVDRMRNGSAYIMFGDGRLAKCNPISEADLARFMVECAVDETKRNAILPVGGPGEPVTPLEQAEMIFKSLGKEPKYQSAPIGLMDVVINFLSGLSVVIPPLKDAAEFGRIGKYYATEDMVGPGYGADTLEAFFDRVAKNGLEGQELGEATVFR